MLRAFISILLGTVPLCALAAGPGSNCAYKSEIYNGTAVSRNFTVAYGCLLTVTPLEKPELLYREYYFDERGGFTIFTSTPGNYETATGKRTYFLFPRKGVPDFSAGRELLYVQSPWGGNVMFLTEPTILVPAGDITIYQPSRTISLADNGGIEIVSSTKIVLDAGWKIGGTAYHDPKGHSIFRDAHNNACEVGNTEIFDYKDAIYDEPLIQFQTDPELEAFLSRRCPKLDLTPLK
jgi:hypothetical protein